MPKAQKNPKFEDALSKLEEIVQKLEGGNLPLDESLAGFEEGMKLVRFCEQKLSEAEGKVEIIVKSAGERSVAKKLDAGGFAEGADENESKTDD